MSSRSATTTYRFPFIRPAVPLPEDWLPYLAESYEQQWFSNFGPAARRLEAAFSEAFGEPGDAFVLTSSATTALAACLIASAITGPVLVPAFTFPATFAAVRIAGGEPVLFDVDPVTWSADSELLERALRNTGARAAVLVAPFGITQDFSVHVSLCEAREAVAVIDNAAGLGGGPRQRCALRGGAFEVYSLHATKPFSVGEGGVIHTVLPQVSALRSAINFGLPWNPGSSPKWGINGKMPEISAAIGLAALSVYDEALRIRRRQAARYVELFDRFDRVAVHRGIADAPWQTFPCLFPDADAADDFSERTERLGLQIRRYYQPSLADWGGIAMADDCSAARDLARRMVCLPVYPRVTEAEIAGMHEIVGAALEKCLGKRT